MPSYSTSYASHTRNGRVPVPSRAFSSLKKIAALENAPRFVLVDAAGAHVVFDYGERLEVRAANGAITGRAKKMDGAVPLVWDHSLFVDDEERDFQGVPAMVALVTGLNAGDKRWALEIGETDASYVVQKRVRTYQTSEPADGGGGATVWNSAPGQLTIQSARFYGPERNASMFLWTVELVGTGVAAISLDRFVSVAMSDQRFLVYDASVTGKDGETVPVATAHLSFVPYDISIIETGVAILSADHGGTAVHVLDKHGAEQWQASVAFAVDAPPIDAGGGRVYLVGRGFAAAERGKVLWAQKSSARGYATSLADGSALLAIGPELRSVSRDGAVLRQVHLQEGEPFVAPPAVANDGTVWVATAKALYVAQ